MKLVEARFSSKRWFFTPGNENGEDAFQRTLKRWECCKGCTSKQLKEAYWGLLNRQNAWDPRKL